MKDALTVALDPAAGTWIERDPRRAGRAMMFVRHWCGHAFTLTLEEAARRRETGLGACPRVGCSS